MAVAPKLSLYVPTISPEELMPFTPVEKAAG
jgi:hypothetical protein